MSQEPHVNQQNHEANKYPSHPGQLQPQPVVATPAVVMVQQPVSVGVAYVLWFFLGGLGVHKFYLKQAVMGVVMLVLWIGGHNTISYPDWCAHWCSHAYSLDRTVDY